MKVRPAPTEDFVAADRLDALASDLRASAQIQGDFRWWQCAVCAAYEPYGENLAIG